MAMYDFAWKSEDSDHVWYQQRRTGGQDNDVHMNMSM